MRIVTLFIVIMTMCSSQSQALNIDGEISVNTSTFDSIDELVSVSTKNGDREKAMQLMKDKGKALYSQGLYANAIISLDHAMKLSDYGKDTIKYPNIKFLYMECLNIKSVVLSYMSRYDEAINCCIEMDKYNTSEDILYKTKFENSMGVVFSMNGKLDQAGDYFGQALLSAKKLNDTKERTYQLFSIYSNLGGVLIAQSKFDSAQMYLMEAQKLAVLIKDKKKEIVCLQLLGMMNSSTGKYELAITCYNEAYKLALELKDDYMLPFLKLNISVCYIDVKNYSAAFTTASEALEMAKKSNIKSIEIKALRNLSIAYREFGNTVKALECIEKSNNIRDSLFSQDNEDKFLRQKTDFDMYRISVEKEMLEKNLELQKSRRIINNILVFILIALLTASSAFLTYKLLKQRRINRALKQQRDLEFEILKSEKQFMEGEIEKKDKELSTKELSLIKKGEQNALVMAKLKVLKTNFPLKGKGFETVKEIEDLIAQMSADNYSESINYYLEQIAPDFYDKLDVLYPELTPGERKICALISLGLTSRDIANITGKTRGAIDNFKSRIRSKVNLEVGVDLTEFFFRIRV